MKITKRLLEKYYAKTFYSIIGFTIGSIFVLFPQGMTDSEMFLSVLCILLGICVSRIPDAEDYERLKQVNAARSKTKSRYARSRLMGNARTRSNGESAYLYFTQKITENALYLLDEPENSLAPARQLELAGFLQDAARFFGCQLVIATHSPFLLAMQGAKVYDLDADPPRPRRWTELENVRAYRQFFADHAAEFETD